MLLVRDVNRTVKFYAEGLQCNVVFVSEHFAELESGGSAANGGIKLSINRVEGEAAVSTGYSPFLCFNVDHLDTIIYKLIQMGATLDGPIKYPAHGKVCFVPLAAAAYEVEVNITLPI
jgi:hypothetical protein